MKTFAFCLCVNFMMKGYLSIQLNSTEIFFRVNVLLLTLNHLSIHMQGISNKGFFHYKTHICFFIDRYWTLLFGPTW